MDMGHATWASEVGGSVQLGNSFCSCACVMSTLGFSLRVVLDAARRGVPFPFHMQNEKKTSSPQELAINAK